MSAPDTVFDLSQCAAGFAEAATLLAEAAQHLSEAARAMSHGLQPELHVPHEPSLEEMNSESKSIKVHDLSTYHSDGEDANTGNNVQGPDSRIGRVDDLDPFAAPLAKKYQLASGSESSPFPSHEVSTVTQGKFRGTILIPGRYYVVLDEDFDILPLIAAYASLCRKTLCCMPFIETSHSWRVLLSAILPSHEVLEVSKQPSAFSPSTGQYISTGKSSLLIQSFTAWQTHRIVSSISDAFVVWGFLNVGEEQLTCIQDTVLSTKHTCAIVTSQEYRRLNFKSYLTSLGFTKHPKSSLIKELHETGFLSTFRTIVQGVLYDQRLYSNICALYKEFLGVYMSPPSKDVRWSETQAAQLANSFAAKTLLHGREEDGSPTFQPDGRMLPVDQNFIDKFGLKRAIQLGLVHEGPPEPTQPRNITPVASPVPSGHWYIILQEAFDVVPFISYQVQQNPKTVCLTSYGTNAKPYEDILKLTTNQHIVLPLHKKAKANKAIATFKSLQSGLLLLPGAKQLPSLLGSVDVAIYWGVPPEPHFTHHLKNLRATHTYILISSVDDFVDKQRATTRNGIREYPGSSQVNSTGPTSLLHFHRIRTRQAMENISPRVPKKLYNAQVGRWVKKGNSVSMRESITRVNQFVARVLLHGEPEDGSMMYPPVQPRPSVKPKHVNKHGLQQFVREGLMWAGHK